MGQRVIMLVHEASRLCDYATRWTVEGVVWDLRPDTADMIAGPGIEPCSPVDSERFPVFGGK